MKLNSLLVKNFRQQALAALSLRLSVAGAPSGCRPTRRSAALHKTARLTQALLALLALGATAAHADVPTRPAPAALPATAAKAPPTPAATAAAKPAKAAKLHLPSDEELARLEADSDKKPQPTTAPAVATKPATAPAASGKAATDPAGPARRAATRPTEAPAKKPVLPLAPSAAEIRREIATRDGGKATEDTASPGSEGDKLGGTPKKRTAGGDLQQRATAPTKQDRRWPTTVDHNAGPTGPAGPGTAGERKGSVIDASGPQQGVIRNRW